MKKYFFIYGLALLSLASCKKQEYAVSSMTGVRTTLNASFNPVGETPMTKLVEKYKHTLEREMGEVIGISAQDMQLGRPESLLTNLTSDAMKLAGDRASGGKCDIAFMNVYGHRSGLAKGNITIGNMFEVYSFENALVLIKVKGSVLTEIFESYAKMGGAGVSSSARIVIDNYGKLLSATVNGQPVDPNKTYTLVTLDYLADGNDGMAALKKADSITPLKITLRDEMINYVKQTTAEGKKITSAIDGRITVKK